MPNITPDWMKSKIVNFSLYGCNHSPGYNCCVHCGKERFCKYAKLES